MNMIKVMIKFNFSVYLARSFLVALCMLATTNLLAMAAASTHTHCSKSEIWPALQIGDVNNIDKIIKENDEVLLEKNHGKTPGDEARIHGFLILGDVLDRLTRKKRANLQKTISRASNKRKSLSIKKARPFIKKSEGLKDKEALSKNCKVILKMRKKFFFEAARGNVGFIKNFLGSEKIVDIENIDYLIFLDEAGQTASIVAEKSGFWGLANALFDAEHWTNVDKEFLEKETMEILIGKIKYFTQKNDIQQVAHLLTYEITNKIFFKHANLYKDIIANFEDYFLAKALSRRFWVNEEVWSWLNEKMLTEKIKNHRRVELINDKNLTDELGLALTDFDLPRINNLIISGADLLRNDIDQQLNEVKKTVLISYALQDYYSWIMYFRPDFQEELEKQYARAHHPHIESCLGKVSKNNEAMQTTPIKLSLNY